MKKSSLFTAVLALAIIPSMALGHVSLVQDGCRQSSPNTIDVLFSVVNFDSPVPICDIHLIPEGTPPDPGCIIIGCSVPAGWACNTNANGGADWQSLAPQFCIGPQQILHGFDFTLDPAFCCYNVLFTGPQGEVLFQQEECFDCLKVSTKSETWGGVKDLYR